MKIYWNEFGVAVPLILVAIAASTLLLRAEPPADCGSMEADLRIQIGGATLALPRRYAPSIFAPEGGLVGSANEICQPPAAPAIAASSLTVTPGDNLPFRAEPEPVTAPIWEV